MQDALGQRMELVIATLFLAGLVFFANEQVRVGTYADVVRQMLYLTLAALAVFVAFTLPASVEGMLLGACFFVLIAANVALVRSQAARYTLKRWLTRTGYHPHSAVHTVALVLATSQLVAQLVSFVSVGGMAGYAETAATQTPNANELLLMMGLYVLIALGGVGFMMRRTFSETLQRLGLAMPTWRDLNTGIALGVLCYVGVFAANLVWQALAPPELYAEQTLATREIFESYSANLGVGLLMAVCAGIGEEILYRGALQPIFGVWATSIYFTLMHTQYTLTPAALLILAVSLVYGWLRLRYGTLAAIVAHSVYNMLPFLLVGILTV